MAFEKRSYRPLIIALFICLVGVACLIAGAVLMIKAKSTKEEPKQPKAVPTCSDSKEASRVGLGEFLQKVQDAYYDSQPYLIAGKPNVRVSEVREKFMSYDPSPTKIKERTDKAWELLKEIEKKDINSHQLKPRERKSLAQVKHFLQNIFGQPYDANYYTGDFLLGPNLFCWQPICNVDNHLKRSLEFLIPATVEDVELVRAKLQSVNHTYQAYIENLRYAVKAGMVRSVEECEAGIQTFKTDYWSVATKGPEGILLQPSLQNVLKPAFLQAITADPDKSKAWIEKHRVPVNESLRNYVVEYVGKPLNELIKFMETEYKQHCVPSDVSSGLATLPLAHVYINGTADLNSTTSKKLPGGEPLNGTWAYQQIMSYFTTTNITAQEVHTLGYEMVNKLYPQILEIAREESGLTNNTLAQEDLQQRLNSSEMYYVGNRTIPANESDKTAHEKCRTDVEARKFCPVRWSIMKDWFKEVNQAMSMIDPKTSNMFYFTGLYHTTPNCPVMASAKYNPASGVPSYRKSDAKCSRPAQYLIPFFLKKPGPRFNQWSVNSHEARPGHHTQVQGAIEHFQDSCGGLIGWLDAVTSYTAFIEGWGLYAETLIADDTDTYNGEPLAKYGMLRSQIWRALRLVVDTGLHSNGFSRQKALQFFVDYAWDGGDVAQKEVTRYQSDPGQATAYMVGQLHLKKLREHARKELGMKFNLKDFHYHLLKQGSAPLSYITYAIGEYIRCTKDNEGEGCEYVLAADMGRGGAAPGTADSNIETELTEYHY